VGDRCLGEMDGMGAILTVEESWLNPTCR
jgi:hypothetical protein